MAVIIDGNNTPTAGGVGYGDGTELAFTAAGTSGQPIVSGGASAPAFRPYTLPAADGSASQVLQTDGAGALSFATPSSSALIFISSATASSSASLTFTSLGLSPKIDFVDTPEDIRSTYQYFTEADMSKLVGVGYSSPFHTLEEGISDYVKNYLLKEVIF